MQTRMQECAPQSIGRQAGRLELELPAQFNEAVQRLSTPNGMTFTAWMIFHVGVWGIGLASIYYLRGNVPLQLLLAVLLGSQLHALTILQHDCGHRSAYASQRLNVWVGRFLAWFIYMPFTTFTELHRRHHGFLGNHSHDPDEWFYEGGSRQLFLRESLFMPRFIYLSLQHNLSAEARQRVVRELIFNSTSYLLLILCLWLMDAADVLIYGFLLPMLLLACLYNPISRGYEHYPMACMRQNDHRRTDLRFNTITVTSRVVGFLWANIIYHVEHHMYPRVPFYRLPALHALFAAKRYHIEPYPLAHLRRYQGEFSSTSDISTLNKSQA